MQEQKKERRGGTLSGQVAFATENWQKKSPETVVFQGFVVAGTGFEPATSGL